MSSTNGNFNIPTAGVGAGGREKKAELKAVAKRMFDLGFAPIPVDEKHAIAKDWSQAAPEKLLDRCIRSRKANGVAIRLDSLLTIDFDALNALDYKSRIDFILDWCKDKQLPPPVLILLSQRGGHAYFRVDKEEAKNYKKMQGDGLDILIGAGCYTVFYSTLEGVVRKYFLPGEDSGWQEVSVFEALDALAAAPPIGVPAHIVPRREVVPRRVRLGVSETRLSDEELKNLTREVVAVFVDDECGPKVGERHVYFLATAGGFAVGGLPLDQALVVMKAVYDALVRKGVETDRWEQRRAIIQHTYEIERKGHNVIVHLETYCRQAVLGVGGVKPALDQREIERYRRFDARMYEIRRKYGLVRKVETETVWGHLETEGLTTTAVWEQRNKKHTVLRLSQLRLWRDPLNPQFLLVEAKIGRRPPIEGPVEVVVEKLIKESVSEGIKETTLRHHYLKWLTTKGCAAPPQPGAVWVRDGQLFIALPDKEPEGDVKEAVKFLKWCKLTPSQVAGLVSFLFAWLYPGYFQVNRRGWWCVFTGPSKQGKSTIARIGCALLGFLREARAIASGLKEFTTADSTERYVKEKLASYGPPLVLKEERREGQRFTGGVVKQLTEGMRGFKVGATGIAERMPVRTVVLDLNYQHELKHLSEANRCLQIIFTGLTPSLGDGPQEHVHTAVGHLARLGYEFATALNGIEADFLRGSPETALKALADIFFEWLERVDSDLTREFKEKFKEAVEAGLIRTVEDFETDRLIRLAVMLLNCLERGIPRELTDKVYVKQGKQGDKKSAVFYVTNEFAYLAGFDGLKEIAATLGLTYDNKAKWLGGKPKKALEIPVDVIEQLLEEGVASATTSIEDNKKLPGGDLPWEPAPVEAGAEAEDDFEFNLYNPDDWALDNSEGEGN